MKTKIVLLTYKKFRKKYLRQPSIDFDFCNMRQVQLIEGRSLFDYNDN